MPDRQIAEIVELDGGLNWQAAPTALGPGQVSILENFLIKDRSCLEGAGGHEELTPSVAGVNDACMSHHGFTRLAAVNQILAHFSDGSLRRSDDPFSSWSTITAGPTLGTTKAVRARFRTYNSNVYIANVGVTYSQWNGTTRTSIGGAPNGSMLEVWKDSMWVAGVAAQPDRVYKSNVGNPEVFNALDFVDIGKGDGHGVVALATDGDFLIVSKRDKTYIIYDPITFANRLVDPRVGAINHDAVVNFENEIFFVGDDGIYLFNPDGAAQRISTAIDPLWEGVFGGNVFDPDFNYPSGYSLRDRIGFWLPLEGGGIPGTIFEYYPRHEKGPWAMHSMGGNPDNIGTFAKVFLEDPAGPVLTFGGRGNGSIGPQIWIGFATTSTPSLTPATVQTGWMNFGTHLPKSLRYLGLQGMHGIDPEDELKVEIWTDFSEDGTFTPDKTFNVDISRDAMFDWGEVLIPVDIVFRWIQVRVSLVRTGPITKRLGDLVTNQDSGNPCIGPLLFDMRVLGDRRLVPAGIAPPAA